MQIILTLPAYNEEQALPSLLAAFADEIRAAGYQGRVVIVDDGRDRKSTRLNSSHIQKSRMPSSA